jgi:uncharacterized protein YndB with AHSA1/START domain
MHNSDDRRVAAPAPYERVVVVTREIGASPKAVWSAWAELGRFAHW